MVHLSIVAWVGCQPRVHRHNFYLGGGSVESRPDMLVATVKRVESAYRPPSAVAISGELAPLPFSSCRLQSRRDNVVRVLDFT